MKKRDISILILLVGLLVGIECGTAGARANRAVRRLLRGEPGLEIRNATRIAGGREPVYSAILVCDKSKVSQLFRSRDLHEVADPVRQREIIATVQRTFGVTMLEPAAATPTIYAGTLSGTAFAAEAMLGETNTYVIFLRF